MEHIETLAYRPAMAAEAAGVTRQTLYRWMHIEGFPVAHIGGCTLIPVQAFKRWLNEQAGVIEDD